MVEYFEVQMFSKYLSLVTISGPVPCDPAVVGTTLRGVVGDPLFTRIGELDQRLRKAGQGVAFGSWEIQRRYSEEELARAQLFLVNIPFTHLSAEEYGTRYQERGDIEHEAETLEHVSGAEFRVARVKLPCSLYSKQLNPLRFPLQKLKKGDDLYRLWGGELIVSQRFVTTINSGRFSGAAFFPTSDFARGELTAPLEFSTSPGGLEVLSVAAAKDMSPSDWDFWIWLNSAEQKPLLEKMLSEASSTTIKAREGSHSGRNLAQLVLQSKPLEVSKRTRFGATPFDTESIGYHQCDAGTIAGMRLISPLMVIRSSWHGSDLCRPEVYVGGQRKGLFRPYQPLIVSKRLFEGLRQQDMKGFDFEVVEMVDTI